MYISLVGYRPYPVSGQRGSVEQSSGTYIVFDCAWWQRYPFAVM
jgi:hypothetical protein